LSGQEPARPPQTTVQRVGVPTAATLDQPMLETLTDITPFTPKHLRRKYFGFLNPHVAVGKMTKRQARAFELAAQNAVDFAQMNRPMYEIESVVFTEEQESMTLDDMNAIQVATTEADRATTTNEAMNERAHIATQGQMIENRNPATPQRKKILGFI
jgi:hypothetical protein